MKLIVAYHLRIEYYGILNWIITEVKSKGKWIFFPVCLPITYLYITSFHGNQILYHMPILTISLRKYDIDIAVFCTMYRINKKHFRSFHLSILPIGKMNIKHLNFPPKPLLADAMPSLNLIISEAYEKSRFWVYHIALSWKGDER